MEIIKNNSKIIERAVKIIKDGGVIICPTDTVYGILTDATNIRAVKKVFEIKKRPKDKAFPIFVKDMKMAKKLAKIDKEQESFLKKAWPGKVTMILEVKKDCNLVKSLCKKTVGLRIPDYDLVNDIIKKVNRPLTGTSANISDKPASTKIKKVLKQFKNEKNQPDLVIDAGNLLKSRSSTVIKLTKDKIEILRKGDNLKF